MSLPLRDEHVIRWDAKGVPHSVTFNDKYFCTQNGYEECCYVADQGNNFRERFSQLDPNKPGTFNILETGFGTGLSFCCVWQLWEKFAPATWSLHYFSVELYPLSNEDLIRALSIWPVLTNYTQALKTHYQPYPNEIKNFYFNHQKICLTIVFDEVVSALQRIHEQKLVSNQADAWLLNGFSPFSNPHMWRLDVFKWMSMLSKKGTTLSTFTVATAVRNGLESQGFLVERIKGYGTKRQILKGVFTGQD